MGLRKAALQQGLILGDQPSLNLLTRAAHEPKQDQPVMAEMAAAATYAGHHTQKLAFLALCARFAQRADLLLATPMASIRLPLQAGLAAELPAIDARNHPVSAADGGAGVSVTVCWL